MVRPVQQKNPLGLDWVENAYLPFAVNGGQSVMYWREEPLEIDGVFEGSWGNWAVEVKTGSFDVQALKVLLEFCRRNTNSFLS